jgi:serine/threonine protein phosphatase PrpC
MTNDESHFKLSVACTQGMRQYMEDTYTASTILNNSILYGIFDGHGGKIVADMCSEKVGGILAYNLRKNYDVSVAIRETFHMLDWNAKTLPVMCGATAVIAFTDAKNDRLWFANCGDSMAMVTFVGSSNGLFVSQDHKVQFEADRIKKAGGVITYDDGCARINRMLNVARSIGDYHLKQFVIPNPYITSVPLQKVKYVVIASDGLWDVYTTDELSKDIDSITTECEKQNMDRKNTIDVIARTIVENSLKKGSTDNITVFFLDKN